MRVFQTFSKRERKRERQGKADVFQYNDFPEPFRVQVLHILNSAIGPYFAVNSWNAQPDSNRVWQLIHDTVAREKGVFSLGKHTAYDDHRRQCMEYLGTASTMEALDFIEIAFALVNAEAGRLGPGAEGRTQDAETASEELNYRFKEHGIGYQFVGGQLTKVDSQYVHAEVVQPAISLLRDQKFRGAEDEFLKAHEHYRHGRNKEAITEALKAFESTMKAICDARKWKYEVSATAKELIRVVFDNGLIPKELASEFSALRSVLESGLPTLRNRMGAHGQGTQPIAVPDYLAAYALHLVASNVVLLAEAHKAKK